MAKLTLTDLTQLSSNETSAVSAINTNQDAVEAAMEITLSRDGTSPNTMEADLDMNSNPIINLPAAGTSTEPVRKSEFDADITQRTADLAAAAASATAAATSETNAAISEALAQEWAVNPEDDDISTNPGEFSALHHAAKASASATSAAASANAANNILTYSFDSTTSDGDPTSGKLRFNNPSPASVTNIWVDNEDINAANVADLLDFFDDGGDTTNRGLLIFRKTTEVDKYVAFKLTGSVTDKTGYRQLTVTYLDHKTGFTNGDEVIMYFAPAGTAGSMTGPGSSTDNAVARFDGVGGVTLQDSGVTVDDTNNLTVPGNIVVTGTVDGRDVATDGTKLDGIEATADVTDAINVAAAGAAMSGGAHHDGFSDFVANEHIDWTSTTEILSTTGTATASEYIIGATGVVRRNVQNSLTVFSGGNASNDGGNIALWGSTHVSNSNDIWFRSGGANRGIWDDSIPCWDWQGKDFKNITEIEFTTGTPIITSGTGTPESAVTANVGSIFMRTDGGAGTSMYVKESGTGNTGWVAK